MSLILKQQQKSIRGFLLLTFFPKKGTPSNAMQYFTFNKFLIVSIFEILCFPKILTVHVKVSESQIKKNNGILLIFFSKSLLSNLIRKSPPEVTQIKNLWHDKCNKFMVKPNNFWNLNILQKRSKKCWKGPSIKGVNIFQGGGSGCLTTCLLACQMSCEVLGWFYINDIQTTATTKVSGVWYYTQLCRA